MLPNKRYVPVVGVEDTKFVVVTVEVCAVRVAWPIMFGIPMPGLTAVGKLSILDALPELFTTNLPTTSKVAVGAVESPILTRLFVESCVSYVVPPAVSNSIAVVESVPGLVTTAFDVPVEVMVRVVGPITSGVWRFPAKFATSGVIGGEATAPAPTV